MVEFVNYFLNGLSLGCIYALIAVGYTMVYGIIKLINFAHGEFYMFGAFVGYFVLTAMGGEANGRDLGYAALFAAVICGGLGTGVLSLVVERIVYRPLRKSGRIVALLAALGVSLFLQNAGQQTVGAKDRTFVHTITSQRYPRFKNRSCAVATQASSQPRILRLCSRGAKEREKPRWWRTSGLAEIPSANFPSAG